VASITTSCRVFEKGHADPTTVEIVKEGLDSCESVNDIVSSFYSAARELLLPIMYII
jgi:hypothetical protein